MRNSIRYLKDQNGKDLIGVQIGARVGKDTLALFRNLDIKMLYIVGPIRLGATRTKLVDLLKEYEDRITWISKKSVDAINIVPDDVDFLFMNGTNSEKAILQDIPIWYPKVKYGGLFSGQDWQKPEVPLSLVDFEYERAYDASRYERLKFQTWDKSGTNTIDWWLVK